MSQANVEHNLFDPSCLELQPSPINGRGLFTARACRAEEVLLIITGDVIDAREAHRRQIDEGNQSIYCLTEDRFIDPPAGHKARYINHSCTPNAIPETRDECSLWVRALRPIAAGEEITIDYDFAEMYELCRQANPLCRHGDCPV